jgi:hypothetical protein
LNGIVRGLSENRSETDPTSPDPRLTGRTYAIPFEDVWQASTRLAGGELRGWSLLRADDQAGVIHAKTKSFLLRIDGDARVEVGLDENAQTRVDVWASSRVRRGDLGTSRRTIARFVHELDDLLGVQPHQILDPTRMAAWLEQA